MTAKKVAHLNVACLAYILSFELMKEEKHASW